MKKIIIGIIAVALIVIAVIYNPFYSKAQTGTGVQWRTDEGNYGNRYSIQLAIDTAQVIITPKLDISEFDGQTIYYGIRVTATLAGGTDSVRSLVRGHHYFQNYSTGTTTDIIDTILTDLGSNKVKWYVDSLNTKQVAPLWKTANSTPYIDFQFFGRAINGGTVYLDIYSRNTDIVPPKKQNVEWH